MNAIIVQYSLYLLLSITLTVWVAQTLHYSGLPFLRECFRGDEELAKSVNHLLRVGFYLVNLGFIALWLRQGHGVETVREVFEALAGKLGIVLLVLGAMHFLNLWVFQKLRHNAKLRERLHLPPVPPTHTEPQAANT